MTSTNTSRIQFMDDLNGAVRDNPVAAGLIGVGVLWMCFGGLKRTTFAGKVPGAARSAALALGDAAESIGDGLAATRTGAGAVIREAGEALASGAEQAATFVRDAVTPGYDALSGAKVPDALGQTSQFAKEVVQSSAAAGAQYATSVQKAIGEAIERQPLMLGAIGLVVGAGLASAFPSTAIEKEMMGEQGLATKERMQAYATEAVETASSRAKEVLEEVKKEAAIQGLTPTGAKDQLQGVAQRVKAAAGTSGGAIKRRLS